MESPAAVSPSAGPAMSGQKTKQRRRRRNILDPGTSGAGLAASAPLTSPQKKLKRLTTGDRDIILVNIYKYALKTKPVDKYISNHDVIKKTSEISGVSERSVYRILGEYRDKHNTRILEIPHLRPEIAGSESSSSGNYHDDQTDVLCTAGQKRSRTLSDDSETSSKIPRCKESTELLEATKNLTAELKSFKVNRDNSDIFECFGKYVASMLRIMPPEKSKDLQPKILSYIMSEEASGSSQTVKVKEEDMCEVKVKEEEMFEVELDSIS